MALKIRIIPITPFEQNSCLIWDEETKEAVLTDVGGEEKALLDAVAAEGVDLKAIWLTHGHLDHASGVPAFLRLKQVDVLGPNEKDDFLLLGMPDQTRAFGFPESEAFIPKRFLKEGEILKVGGFEFEVIEIPGHTPGSVVYHCPKEKVLIAGDVLFRRSIGRTDFPRSNTRDLLTNIKEKLFRLPPETTVIPGHGPLTTIGEEMRLNPFLR